MTASYDILNYADFVARRLKPGFDIRDSLPSYGADALHAVLGLTTEVGEAADIVKREFIYQQDDEREALDAHMKEEIGDILFYLAALADVYGCSIPECIAANVEKLAKRYPEGYSDDAAVARADKEELES